ncbi:hypothetical protein P3T76_000870 [Phytophthora citrophthora]|uniref:BZIP domain-containing protein n=1 Tax=Phytophthora citrophthora TaxID=4793 RepID=A0AAD9H1R5_9STRA|nr:hypothetical protein P3T76_000870 [Phytophthora citrophthora]
MTGNYPPATWKNDFQLIQSTGDRPKSKIELSSIGIVVQRRHSATETFVACQLPAQIPLPIDRQTILLVKAQAEADLELRRTRNRMHQAKHKLKQKKRVKDLENVVVCLQEEIQQLTFQRRIVRAGVSTILSSLSEWIQAPMVKFEQSPAIPGVTASLSPIEYHEQREFLLATIAPDVASDRGYGVEAHLENWRQLSSIFPDIQIQLLRLESAGDNTAVGETRMTVYLSDKTLRRAFPQLIEDEKGFRIAGRLLGQQISMHGSSFVASLLHNTNILAPLLRLLGNLEDVSRVFEGATITTECKPNLILFPPNRQNLSEGIVRQVVQRSRPQSRDLFAVAASGSSSMHQIDDTRHLPMNETEMKRVAADIELRRQRNRMHQAKHKMKQQKKVLDLEIGIRQLRNEIQQLKMQKEIISAGVSTNTTVWSVAAEYFRLFRNGFKGPMVMLQPSTSEPSLVSLRSRESFVQKDFFIATMAEDVMGDTGFGVQRLLDGWKQLSMYHEDMEIELIRLDVGPDEDLIATVRSATTMSEKALRHGFPHLFDDGEWTPLGVKLLDQRMVMHGVVSFVWDEDRGRVSSLQYSVDMLTPVMQVLGNLEDVARVFGRAQVTPDSRLRTSHPAYAPSSDARVLLSLQSPSPPTVHFTNSNGHFRLPSLTVQKSRQSSKTKAPPLDVLTAYRRQRNRMHQARHKMKQRKKVEDLESSIQQLREEVQELKLQREVITTGVMSGTTVWNVAAEYFRVFRYGVGASPRMALPSPFQVETQRSFLHSTMASNVMSETGFGVDALIDNWSFVTTFHPDIDVQLVSLENDADGFMVGRTLGRLTITENTLRNAFPQLLSDGMDTERVQLAARLLGQQVVMRGCVQFEWDSEMGRVARVQHKADLLTPLLDLLGSLEAVSCVFDNALVTPESTSVAW